MNIASVVRSKGRNVVTVTPDTPIPDVLERMRAQGVGAVVVSGDGSHVDGMIAERHIVLGLARHGEKLLHMRAGQIMGQPLTCRAEDSVKQVMAEMTARRVRQCPVIESGKVSAVISLGDIVKFLVDEAELEGAVLRDRFLASQ
jgi:CBS domain-containing protein